MEFLLSDEENSSHLISEGTTFPPKCKKGIVFEHGSYAYCSMLAYGLSWGRNGFLWACGKVVLYALFVISALYPCVISHPSLTKAFVSVWLHSGRWRFFSSFALAGLPDPGQSRPPWKSTEVRYHYYQFHLVCIRLLVNSFSRKFYNHRLIRRGSLKAIYCNACSQMARSGWVA